MKIYSDSLHKIAYATDASVYREIPYGVAYPETIEDVQELMRTAREKGIDLIPRAGGTSIAGQLMITTHPQRWNDFGMAWITELLTQNVKNNRILWPFGDF